MAQKLGRQTEWPREKRTPEAYFLTADGWLNSERPLVGPLRHGTTPGVGPTGRAVVADDTRRSDFGMDRIEPRDFDPMGTSRRRFGTIDSGLIARSVRGGRDS